MYLHMQKYVSVEAVGAPVKMWHAFGQEPTRLFDNGKMMPSSKLDAVYAWKAPSSGRAHISGFARDDGASCGRKVRMIIKAGDGEQIWQRKLTNLSNAYNFNFDINLQEGEQVYFRASYDGGAEGPVNAACGSSSIRPTVAFEELCLPARTVFDDDASLSFGGGHSGGVRSRGSPLCDHGALAMAPFLLIALLLQVMLKGALVL